MLGTLAVKRVGRIPTKTAAKRSVEQRVVAGLDGEAQRHRAVAAVPIRSAVRGSGSAGIIRSAVPRKAVAGGDSFDGGVTVVNGKV